MFIRNIIFILLTCALTLGVNSNAYAKQNKYASIIIDADTMEILHARKIDEARYPASLTKMMTLYLAFDALDRGQIHLSDKIRITRRAQTTPPVRLGLKAGKTITVGEAIQALTVRSANDAAVTLAEYIGGSEDEFAFIMTAKAKQLGMQSTIFKNAHGLPNEAQTTTARDMAKLAHALLQNHPGYYPYFSQKSFAYNGRVYHNHNTLLGVVDGVDGFKTGYTNASGFNLVLSAKRDGRRIIAVVLGGASGKSRDKHMADLIERGFKVQNQSNTLNAASARLNADLRRSTTIRKVTPVTNRISAYTLRASHNSGAPTVRIVRGNDGMKIARSSAAAGWAIQIGAFSDAKSAQSANFRTQNDAALKLSKAQAQIIPVSRKTGLIYRARITNLSAAHAQKTCAALTLRGQSCMVISPS